MNIKKSIKISLAKSEKDQNWLADKMGMIPSSVTSLMKINNPRANVITKLAECFNLKASKFVALGESDAENC